MFDNQLPIYYQYLNFSCRQLELPESALFIYYINSFISAFISKRFIYKKKRAL